MHKYGYDDECTTVEEECIQGEEYTQASLPPHVRLFYESYCEYIAKGIPEKVRDEIHCFLVQYNKSEPCERVQKLIAEVDGIDFKDIRALKRAISLPEEVDIQLTRQYERTVRGLLRIMEQEEVDIHTQLLRQKEKHEDMVTTYRLRLSYLEYKETHLRLSHRELIKKLLSAFNECKNRHHEHVCSKDIGSHISAACRLAQAQAQAQQALGDSTSS